MASLDPRIDTGASVPDVSDDEAREPDVTDGRPPERGARTPTMLAVWAPRAKQVDVEIGGERFALLTDGQGWWVSEREAPTGAEYVFHLDGEGPFPDPRSRWQPHGVDGPSCVVPDDFTWTDAGFEAAALSSGLVYELHVGTFTPAGTFLAAVERLDHLAALGVTHVELMPVNAFAGERGWGYDGVALYSPHPAYGRPGDLKRLVDECHARGMAVLLDVVYNHFGPAGNYLPRFGPYLTDLHRTPWGPAVNLEDADSHEVRRFFVDNARHWLETYHFDGLRVDAVHAFLDRSAIPFGEELAREVHRLAERLGRRLVVIAESDLNDPRVVRPRNEGGWGCDAQWSDDFHHALHVLLTGERQGYYADFDGMAALAKALRQGYVYDGVYSPYRRRRHGRPPTGLPGAAFVVFTQNHDQVGNRARGERLVHLAGAARARIAAAVLFTSPFVPLLFQGEEWGARAPFRYFTDHEPELGAAVTRGRREEFASFGWNAEDVPDPQAPQTFLQSKLDWSERAKEPHRGLLDWYQALIRLRRAQPALAPGDPGDVRTEFDERGGWFGFDRGPLSTAFNIGTARARVPLPAAREHRVLLASEGVEVTSGAVDLAPDSVCIIEARS